MNNLKIIVEWNILPNILTFCTKGLTKLEANHDTVILIFIVYTQSSWTRLAFMIAGFKPLMYWQRQIKISVIKGMSPQILSPMLKLTWAEKDEPKEGSIRSRIYMYIVQWLYYSLPLGGEADSLGSEIARRLKGIGCALNYSVHVYKVCF